LGQSPGQSEVGFGWLLSYRADGSVVFKEDEAPRAIQIPVAEIEGCGAV